MSEKTNNLFSKNVDIEPVAVVYNTMGSTIEEFVEKLFIQKYQIDGVAAVRTKVVKEGSNNPAVNVYIFINLNSKDLSSNIQGVVDILRDKIADNTYQYSQKLKNALYSVCRNIAPVVSERDGVLIVRADIFKVLGLMFNADPKFFEIGMLEVVKHKKNCAVSVMKKMKFVGSEDIVTDDKFSNMLRNIED